jgi:hypothetical protein
VQLEWRKWGSSVASTLTEPEDTALRFPVTGWSDSEAAV